jgi:hypothetical protein
MTVATLEESTVKIIAQTVDTEEENRRLCEQDQLRDEADQLRQQMLGNTPIAAYRDVGNGDVSSYANPDGLPRSDNPQCGTKRRR